MSERNTKLLISDLLDSIGKIKSYTLTFDFDDFCKNELVIDAVIRNFEIIGEPASRLPKSFTSEHKNISWRTIKNFRNVLIHEYFGIDLKLVWDVIEKRLPPLEKDLIKIYSTLSDPLF